MPSRKAFLRAWLEFRDDGAIAAITRFSITAFARNNGRCADIYHVVLAQDPPSIDVRTPERMREELRRRVSDVLQCLPRSEEGRMMLTKRVLGEVWDVVGWHRMSSTFIGSARYHNRING